MAFIVRRMAAGDEAAFQSIAPDVFDEGARAFPDLRRSGDDAAPIARYFGVGRSSSVLGATRRRPGVATICPSRRTKPVPTCES